MTITKSGELVSFYTVNKAPIKHLKVYFSPKQAGEGTPSPENVREIEGLEYINTIITGESLTEFNTPGAVRWYVPEEYLTKTILYHGFIDNSSGTSIIKLSLRLRDANNTSLGTYYSTQTVQPGECKSIMALVNIPDNVNSIQFAVSNAQNTIIKSRGIYPYTAENSIYFNLDSVLYGGYVDLVTGELV